MINFWKGLHQAVFLLAPMEDVTDTTFREVVLSLSEPDCLHVIFTEFTSTDGLCHEKGRPNVISRLKVNESERRLLKEKNVKLVAQIWGSKPENHYRSAKIISEMGFDGIDVNMGCPIKKIVKQGGCSALIGEPELAGEIIQASMEGSELPVSVKTRIGINKIITDEWVSHLLEFDLPALTVHGRTQKMQSDGLADWNEIEKAARLRDEMEKDTLIFGNGDVMSLEEGMEKIKRHQLDGVMIGRGIFRSPWFFSTQNNNPSIKERLDVLCKHARLFHKTWDKKKNFAIQKRFFKIYVNNFAGAAELRAKLMETSNLDEVEQVIMQYKRI